jgi:hypothetical protein
MNLAESQRPNLKPFRDVDPHNVIGMYAHVDGSANKGTLVKLSTVSGNTNVIQDADSPANPYISNVSNRGLDNLPSYVYAHVHEVAWKVDNTTSGDAPLGFLLNDVRTVDYWGQDMHYQHQKRAEGDIVESGQPVNILTKGILLVNGVNGTPAAGDAAYVSATVEGEIDSSSVTTKTRVDYVGKFLTPKDAQGFALLKVEL